MTYIYHDGSEDAAPVASGFEKLLGQLQAGDCLVVERLSGAAKDAAGLMALLQQLEERGIRLRSVQEDFDTGTEQGHFAVTILRAVLQLEEQARKERQEPKEDARTKGRKPIEVDEEMFDSILERWKNGEITARQAMAELDLKPNTFYRRVKERMPETKTTDSILDVAKKLGKEIASTVAEGSEEITQAAGKFAAGCDMSTLSDTVKKNITAAGAVLGRHIDSLSRDFQDAVEKFEKKQQEAAKPREDTIVEQPAAPEASPAEEEPIVEQPAPQTEETEYL